MRQRCERVSIECRESSRDSLRHLDAVVANSRAAGQFISQPMMPESRISVLDVVVELAQRMVQVDGVCYGYAARQHALRGVARGDCHTSLSEVKRHGGSRPSGWCGR